MEAFDSCLVSSLGFCSELYTEVLPVNVFIALHQASLSLDGIFWHSIKYTYKHGKLDKRFINCASRAQTHTPVDLFEYHSSTSFFVFTLFMLLDIRKEKRKRLYCMRFVFIHFQVTSNEYLCAVRSWSCHTHTTSLLESSGSVHSSFHQLI